MHRQRTVQAKTFFFIKKDDSIRELYHLPLTKEGVYMQKGPQYLEKMEKLMSHGFGQQNFRKTKFEYDEVNQLYEAFAAFKKECTVDNGNRFKTALTACKEESIKYFSDPKHYQEINQEIEKIMQSNGEKAVRKPKP